MDKTAQSTRGASLCEYCRRPWFGLVAYCPYCGHPTSVTTINQDSADRASPPDDAESEPDTAWTAAPLLQGQEAASRQPLPLHTGQGLPPATKNKTAGPRSNAMASTLLLSSAVTGIGALLLYGLAVALHTYDDNKAASAGPMTAGSSIWPQRRNPSSETAQMGAAPRTDAASSPNSDRSLCSARDEAAGLCKPQP